MRVSVIVPLYNKAACVLRCVRSIAAQTFTDFEVIIVDDGSTDGSAGTVAAILNDARFRLLSQTNAGPGAARNRGAAAASGEYLAFLDADDEWTPEYLASNLAALSAVEGAAAVTSGYIRYPGGVNRENFWRARGLQEGLFTASAGTPPVLLVHVLAYMSFTMVRADVFRTLGGFYDRGRSLYGEDSWLWIQVLLNAPVLIRFEPLTLYHSEDSELSANLAGARQVEPFLLDPAPLRRTCPPQLDGLLRKFLAIRALKTACVLGYWGRWREAGEIRRRYSSLKDARLPLFAPALICSTPLGSILGKLWRLRPGRGV
jgi:hypothetical protein